MSMFDWLIVGAGFAGSVLAERLSSQLGDRVLLIDRRSHIGGNAYDRFDANGSLIPLYGRHILQTDNVDVLRYLSTFTSWRQFPDAVERADSAADDGEIATDRSRQRDGALSFTMFRKSLNAVTGFAGLSESVGRTGLEAVEVESIEHLAGQQIIPAEGYTRMFERMLSSPNVKIMLNIEYGEISDVIPFRRLIYTGSIDEYFDYCYGKLPYEAIDRDEHGYPSDGAEGKDLFRRYEELAQASATVFFVGRLATYRFLPMDEVVSEALATFERIKEQETDPERSVDLRMLRSASPLS